MRTKFNRVQFSLNRVQSAITACLAFSLVYAGPYEDWAAGQVESTVYPSTGTAWIIPGAHVAPTDPATLAAYPTADAVADWEVQHADVAYGADYGVARNAQIASIGYMYNQTLDFDPSATEMHLRQRCIAEGVDYEDFFLHFAEDTVLSVPNTTHATETALNGHPAIVGYTADPTHAGFWIYEQPPYDKAAWSGHQSDGGLYVYLFEPFDSIELSLSQVATAGDLVIEYPSAIDAQGVVSTWSELTPLSEGTRDLSQSGTIRWQPPSDWQFARTHDGTGRTYGGGPYFGTTMMRDGGAMYVIRLLWKNGTGDEPRLEDVQLRQWQSQTTPGDPSERLIPGWDPANDVNDDGYVDDSEYASLVNPGATARFRYESRACPLGRMWSSRSSFCRTNVFDTHFRTFVSEYHRQQWQTSGILGAYNDDMFKLVGPDEYLVQSGGTTHELTNRIDTEAANTEYLVGFADLFSEISSVTGSDYISSNISADNLFVSHDRLPFTTAIDAFLREDYIRAGTGFTGFFGLSKMWDTFAYAALGKKTIIQATFRSGLVRSDFPNTNMRSNWDRDAETLLAQYYLLHMPDSTYLNMWNWSFNYGSGNTTAADYHTAGIPKNIAYQPEALLQVDMGVPVAGIPSGQTPIPYMVATSEGSYTVLGDSDDVQLAHAEIGSDGTVDVVPSYIYYLQQSGTVAGLPGVPAEMVLARHYTRGLVLYRTATFTGNETHRTSSSGALPLPQPCRRVSADGSFGPVIEEIDLAGYQGALLRYADYSEWVERHGIADALPGDDADSDGLTNFDEFVLVTDPTVDNGADIEIDQSGWLQYRKARGATGHTVVLEQSADMQTWQTSALTISETLDADGHYEYRADALASLSAPDKQFFRVRVEAAP